MAPRRLWGWEPREVVAHQHDEAGRLTRSVVTREPEFDEEQRNLLLALVEIEDDTCPGCRQPISLAWTEATDPDNPDASHHFAAPFPRRCHGCDAREQRAEEYREATRPAALRFGVHLTDGPKRPR